MAFPQTRLRRLRANSQIREMLRETKLEVSSLIAPLFIVPGKAVRSPIKSLEGQFHLSVDQLPEQAKKLRDLGIKSVLLFGIPETKDEVGSAACRKDGTVQRGIEAIREAAPDLLCIPDLCFCEYTSHGHCGIIKNADVDNDATLKILCEQGLSLARAGAQILAPSGMMDGMVCTLRRALDEAGFQSVSIMSYSAKFASAYYGPFREAVDSSPAFGDRRTYQMDPGNIEEALREVQADIEEGADIVMVKPALAYLDVIRAVKEKFKFPTAAYNVSGEYAMIKLAAKHGLVEEARIVEETLLSIKRAGADLIITYFAEDLAKTMQA